MSSDSDEQDEAVVQEREVAAEPDAQAVEEVEDEAEGLEEEVEEETEEKESEKIEDRLDQKVRAARVSPEPQRRRSAKKRRKPKRRSLLEKSEARQVEATIIGAPRTWSKRVRAHRRMNARI